MPYKIINDFANRQAFRTQEEAQKLLSTFPVQTQGQLISAMYIGRNHLHQSTFSKEDEPYVNPEGLIKYCDQIMPADYAKILHEKGQSTITYFQRFVECARNKGLM